MYTSSLIWNWSTMRHVVVEANDGLFSDGFNGPESLATYQKAVHVQSTIATASLLINVSMSTGKVDEATDILSRFSFVMLLYGGGPA